MKFTSPVQNVFMEEEFGSILEQAKDCQLNFSLKKINGFKFIQDDIIDEIMPDETPEILLKRRRKIIALKNNARKRI